MRLILIFSVLLVCTISKAQTSADLKGFINKNNVAIRSVQKNMLRENNSSYISSFKELLKNQETAVKLYNSNKDASFYFASLVRNESLSFLKSHSVTSTVYLEISDSEKLLLKSNTEKNKNILTSDDLKIIENIDAMNPQSLNTLTLTIQ